MFVVVVILPHDLLNRFSSLGLILISSHGMGGFDPACDVHSLFTSLIDLIDQGDECLSLQRGGEHQRSSDVRADLYVFRWVAKPLPQDDSLDRRHVIH